MSNENAGLPRLLRTVRRRLANRPDSEHEQAFIRIVVVGLLATYFGILTLSQGPDAPPFLVGTIFALAYIVLACGYIGWIVAEPGVVRVRRVLGMITDQTTLSVLIFIGGVWGGPLYPIYLWITFGNGFRYGNAYLTGAAVMSLTGFLLVAWFNPFWHDHPALTVGLMLGLIALPAYVASLIRKLTEAKRNAEAANHAKSRFLATMSHELRTPLNAVIGLSDLLSSARLDHEQANMVSLIGSSGRVLLALINDVLDLAKIEAGKGNVQAIDFDLAAELDRSLAILRPQAEQKGLRLSLALDGSVPVRARGDIRHLRQGLLNLLSNAIKFTDSGGVVLRARAEPMTGGHWLVLAVEDSGIGIDGGDLEEIFEAFKQSDAESNRHFGGTGLGLAIARGLAEAVGGTLKAESVKGAGSTFTLGLPLATPYGPPENLPAIDEMPMQLVAPGRSGPDPAAQIESAGIRLITEGESAAAKVTCFDLSDTVYADGEAFDTQILAQLANAARPCRVCLVLTGDRLPLHRDLTFALGNSVRIAMPLNPDVLRNGLALVAALSTETAQARFADAELKDVRNGRSGRVLVVEDNPVNRKVTAKILERGGHVPVLVGSGEAALDVLDGGDIDAVLMDVNMPGDTGIETVKLYRFTELGSDRRLPILALTADATVETRQACQEAGMDEFITKPVDALNLLRTLDRHLQPDVAAIGLTESVIDDGREAANHAPAVDQAALGTLWELDPSGDFVSEIVAEFVADTDSLLTELDEALAAADRTRAQDILHALKSSAGNVGAARLRVRAIALARAVAMSGTERSGYAVAELRADARAYRAAVALVPPSGFAGTGMAAAAPDGSAQIIPMPVGRRVH